MYKKKYIVLLQIKFIHTCINSLFLSVSVKLEKIISHIDKRICH